MDTVKPNPRALLYSTINFISVSSPPGVSKVLQQRQFWHFVGHQSMLSSLPLLLRTQSLMMRMMTPRPHKVMSTLSWRMISPAAAKAPGPPDTETPRPPDTGWPASLALRSRGSGWCSPQQPWGNNFRSNVSSQGESEGGRQIKDNDNFVYIKNV